MDSKLDIAARSHLTSVVRKRYQAATIAEKRRILEEFVALRRVAETLDPLKLLEEIRAVQAHLVSLADGKTPPGPSQDPPDLSSFIAGLSSAWRAGEIRPTFSMEAKPRYLRGLQTLAPRATIPLSPERCQNATPAQTSTCAKILQRPPILYAETGHARVHSLQMAWPIVCRRLEELPNVNASQLFDELCIQFPSQFTPRQYKSFLRKVNRWRADARARGVDIGPKTYRRFTDKPRGRRPDIFRNHWEEMVKCLEERPDQTALELLVEIQARYPGCYTQRQLYTLEKRVREWRRNEVNRLVCEIEDLRVQIGINATEPRPAASARINAGNTLREASGNKIT